MNIRITKSCAYFGPSSLFSAGVLTATVSLMASADIGVDVTALGLAERPRNVPAGVLFDGVGVSFSSLASSLDGVEARESLSLLPVLVPSGFFGFGVAAVYFKQEK